MVASPVPTNLSDTSAFAVTIVMVIFWSTLVASPKPSGLSGTDSVWLSWVFDWHRPEIIRQASAAIRTMGTIGLSLLPMFSIY
jgi:hypothetical protein